MNGADGFPVRSLDATGQNHLGTDAARFLDAEDWRDWKSLTHVTISPLIPATWLLTGA